MIAIPNLEKATRKATALICSQRKIRPISNINIMDFGGREIVFDTIQNYADITGLRVKILLHDVRSPLKDGLILHEVGTNIFVVLYNDIGNTETRTRWTIAHELGHIMLGHCGNTYAEEQEANTFAAQLLMPWFTIKMMGIIRKPSAEHIARTFGVSITAANNRIMDVQKINLRPSLADKLIYSKQRPYITDEPRKEPLSIDILDRVIVGSNRL